MSLFYDTSISLVVFLFAFFIVLRKTNQCKLFAQDRALIISCFLFWMALAVWKIVYLDLIFPPSDALTHEYVSRNIATSLQAGFFSEALPERLLSNELYQFIYGIYYAATNAPLVTVYMINGTIGFYGLLLVIELGCRITSCQRIPATLIALILLAPSPPLWCTTHLKEGLMLWSIAAMLSWIIPKINGTKQCTFLATTGTILGGLLRPHITILVLTGIGFHMVVKSRRYFLASLVAVSGLACFMSLEHLAPNLHRASINTGISASLAERHSTLTQLQTNHRNFATGSPIPIITGLGMIALRPFPHEVSSLVDLLAGLEIWGLAFWGSLNWLRTRSRFRELCNANLTTLLVCLLSIAFLFTYSWNLGLTIRQRVMAFPILFLMYAWPIFMDRNIHTKNFSSAQRQTRLLQLRTPSIMVHNV